MLRQGLFGKRYSDRPCPGHDLLAPRIPVAPADLTGGGDLKVLLAGRTPETTCWPALAWPQGGAGRRLPGRRCRRRPPRSGRGGDAGAQGPRRKPELWKSRAGWSVSMGHTVARTVAMPPAAARSRAWRASKRRPPATALITTSSSTLVSSWSSRRRSTTAANEPAPSWWSSAARYELPGALDRAPSAASRRRLTVARCQLVFRLRSSGSRPIMDCSNSRKVTLSTIESPGRSGTSVTTAKTCVDVSSVPRKSRSIRSAPSTRVAKPANRARYASAICGSAR
ncbi:MAG: hypothetical protein QOE61_736 [Micromonosporaceae bacterium]|nr:hypothetical protein [Micromonosporaceae bacterium]